jgi:hypothetical protein
MALRASNLKMKGFSAATGLVTAIDVFLAATRL